jgi:Tfp pilus assembly protein PilX
MLKPTHLQLGMRHLGSSGDSSRDRIMKAPLLIALAAMLVAMMNNACKSGHDNAWCAPISSVRHHVNTGHK